LGRGGKGRGFTYRTTLIRNQDGEFHGNVEMPREDSKRGKSGTQQESATRETGTSDFWVAARKKTNFPATAEKVEAGRRAKRKARTIGGGNKKKKKKKKRGEVESE